MPPRQAVLGMEHASFFYGSTPVFRNVSFLLDDARTALVGENGAGKSTLLKCLTGALELNAGQVIRSRSLRIGSVPQDVPMDLADRPVRDVLHRSLERIGQGDDWWRIDLLLDEIGVEPGKPQRHARVDIAVAELEPPLAHHVGLRAVGLDAGDAALDGVLALVEIGILDRPHLVARRRLLEPLDLLVLELGAGRRAGVLAQQLLAR